jgi:hypothetical protein
MQDCWGEIGGTKKTVDIDEILSVGENIIGEGGVDVCRC